MTNKEAQAIQIITFANKVATIQKSIKELEKLPDSKGYLNEIMSMNLRLQDVIDQLQGNG